MLLVSFGDFKIHFQYLLFLGIMSDFFNDMDIFILGDIRTYLELLFQLTSFDTTPAGEREGSITSLLTSGDRSLGFLVVPVDTQKKETAPSFCQVGM